jgi:hypothetical protein
VGKAKINQMKVMIVKAITPKVIVILPIRVELVLTPLQRTPQKKRVFHYLKREKDRHPPNLNNKNHKNPLKSQIIIQTLTPK